jgi:hypothetical protein
LMAGLMAHEKGLEQVRMYLAAFHAEKPLAKGNLPHRGR